jgi:hypothetical protein
MPLIRNDFIPQSMTTVYTSPSGMTDLRTNLPYYAGGLVVGGYFDLTEAEAQAVGPSLHYGRYRFVQVDSGATASNIKTGTIGLMKSLAQGPNFITSYDLGLNGSVRPVVFLAPLTATQVAAGAWVFVQELGDATVLGKTGGVTNATPAVGDVINSIAGGLAEDLATPGSIVPTTIGEALTLPSHTATATFRVLLDNVPVIQG